MTVDIQIDKNLQMQSEAVLAQLGLSTTAVVGMLLRTIVRNKAVPAELFTIANNADDNAAYLAKLDKSFAEYEQGLGAKHKLIEV